MITPNKNLHLCTTENFETRYGINFVLTAPTFQIFTVCNAKDFQTIRGPIKPEFDQSFKLFR